MSDPPPDGAWRPTVVPTGAAACAALVLGLALVFLVLPVGQSGIWDPYELDRAELARRIAIHVFGATELTLEGAANGMPTLSDLGSGELPFTSMALGLARFGLHDWAARLPLALWAVMGALALYAILARLVSPRAGLYGAAALCTMPIYFLHARVMLGDVVTMAAFTLAFAGLAGAMLDGRSRLALAVWLALGLVGLGAGYLARGVLFGLSAPLLGVGLGWLVLALSPAGFTVLPRRGRELAPAPGTADRAALVGLGALAAGVFFAFRGAAALAASSWGAAEVARVLGFRIQPAPPVESTFDWMVRELGHGLFPWSALLPFVFARVLSLPPGLTGDERARELGLRVLVLTGAAVAYAVHTWLAPYSGALPFVAPALLAAVVAMAVVDFERGAPASGALGIGTLVLGTVLLMDLRSQPARTLSALSIADPSFPASFEPDARRLLAVASLVFGGVVALAWLDRPAPRSETLRAHVGRRLRRYRESLTELNGVWGGWFVFGFLLLEAGCIGLAVMVVIGRNLEWSNVTRMPRLAASLSLNAWWVLPLLALGSPVALDLGRLALATVLRHARLTRAAATVAAALVASGILSFRYYPALADQLSPKEALERYAELHAPGEPLGLLSLSARMAPYYSEGEQVEALPGAGSAMAWLEQGLAHDPPRRRWLLLKSRDLPALNALMRRAHRENLPVLHGAGQILLASNQLAGQPNDNPLDALVSSDAPVEVQHPLAATFDDRLEALGWDLLDARGRPARYAVPGRAYQLVLWFRSRAPIGRDYQVFVHVDGQQRRHNSVHAPLEGRYRTSLWQPGDVLTERYEMVLEPNFLPGDYRLFFGFCSPCEDDSGRLPVTAGRHHKNRVLAGVLSVR